MTTCQRNSHNLLIYNCIIELSYERGIKEVIGRLNEERGLAFSSNTDFPGRYRRWEIALINPPIVINASGLTFSIEALNARGKLLLIFINQLLNHTKIPIAFEQLMLSEDKLEGQIECPTEYFIEEMRSKQPSIFSLLRGLIDIFNSDDPHLGFYGSFGYDLSFQFEPIKLAIDRDPKQRDFTLYFPDEIYTVDHRRQMAIKYQYEFEFNGQSTRGLPREGKKLNFSTTNKCEKDRSMAAGRYAEVVQEAKEYFKRGDLFEVVPGQSFYRSCQRSPAELFNELCQVNPSPYSFVFNLGEEEYLVGISPEMYVRVTGDLVETRPISGTIKRGSNVIEDAENILKLLNSKKDESELTMCTDVDRNDKSRVCLPGSVKLTGRREVEKYSKLFHTVDHIEGTLSPEFDAIDAFLTHMWAVTVTGAPKKAAIQFIENHEPSPRNWYGGAIGWMLCNGDMNTGMTIRTIQIKKGIAEVRVGATLLYDSNPEDEEKETELKASALLEVLKTKNDIELAANDEVEKISDHNLLFIDHEDSFINTLSNYFRQYGAKVTTVRYDFQEKLLDDFNPDLILLSPGPGNPKQFNLSRSIELALQRKIPIFGVCLGLQGIVEYFGGTLKTLDYPVHGKKTLVEVVGGNLFQGLPKKFNVGRYHSLYVDQSDLPDELIASAVTKDGIVMAIEHRHLPIAAVQFHPESIMTLEQGDGMKIIKNVFSLIDTYRE